MGLVKIWRDTRDEVRAEREVRDRIQRDRRAVEIRFESALKNLDKHAQTYKGIKYDGALVRTKLTTILHEVRELVARAHVKSSIEQLFLIKNRYASILEQVVALSAPGYLRDIIKNPQYWPDADRRAKEIIRVLDVLPQQIVANIQQVNTASDLDFQIALAALQLVTGDIAEAEALAASAMTKAA